MPPLSNPNRRLDVACARVAPANAEARIWSAHATGKLRLAQARPCLEQLVALANPADGRFDFPLVKAAIDATVDVGSAWSVDSLEGLAAGVISTAVSDCDPSLLGSIVFGLGTLGAGGLDLDVSIFARPGIRAMARSTLDACRFAD